MDFETLKSSGHHEFPECGFLKNSSVVLRRRQQEASMKLTVVDKKFKKFSECLELLFYGNPYRKFPCKSLSDLQALKNKKSLLQAELTKHESLLCDDLVKEHLSYTLTGKKMEAISMAQSLKELKAELVEVRYDEKQNKKTIKSSLDALKAAKLSYKDVLDLHISVLHADKDYIEVLINYSKIPHNINSLKLQLILNGNKWKLIETNPLHPNFKELSTKLEKSQDIKGLIAFLRSSVRSRYSVSAKSQPSSKSETNQ